MAVSAANRIQAANSGGPVTGAGFTATLPNPTLDGGTLFLFWAVSGSGAQPQLQSFDPPFFMDGNSTTGPVVWRRDAQPAGETSWAIASTGGVSGTWLWRAEEWAGLTSVGNPDANAGVRTNAGNPGITNNVTPDVGDFAALAAFYGATPGAGLTWPSGRVYPSGWNEVDYLTNGTGGGSFDFVLAVAESYPGAASTFNTQITWDTSGGGSVPNQTNGWLACYQPSSPPPAVVALSAPAP